MSKYEPLWSWVGRQTAKNLTLTFAEMQQILDFPIDHSFFPLAAGQRVLPMLLLRQAA